MTSAAKAAGDDFAGVTRGAATKSRSTTALHKRSSKFKLVSRSLNAIPATTSEEAKQGFEDGDEDAVTEKRSALFPSKISIKNIFSGSNTAAAAASI